MTEGEEVAAESAPVLPDVLPVLPLRPLDRIDIVPADWVAAAIVKLHRGEPRHETYHLSAGRLSEQYRRITDAIARALGGRRPTYVPVLEKPFGATVAALARVTTGKVQLAAKLLDVFYPYLIYDTVFDSSRVIEETETRPEPFTGYCTPLLQFARRNGFRFPYVGWMGDEGTGESAAPVAADLTAGGSTAS